MNIAITSGYRHSLHAICLLALLNKHALKVRLCLNVSTLNLRRLRFYVRQLGLKSLIQKYERRVWNLRAPQQLHPEMKYIHKFMNENDIRYTDLKDACKELCCDYVTVSDLNSSRAISQLQSNAIDLVVYCGGGILRRSFIDTPDIGVLNAHAGPLPHFRGMNATEWSLFYGIQPGVTVHFIDQGVDTGPIMFYEPQPVEASDTIYDVRGKIMVLSVRALLRAVRLVASGEYTLRPQDPAGGRQFFVMASALLSLVEQKTADGLIKPYDASRFKFAEPQSEKGHDPWKDGKQVPSRVFQSR